MLRQNAQPDRRIIIVETDDENDEEGMLAARNLINCGLGKNAISIPYNRPKKSGMYGFFKLTSLPSYYRDKKKRKEKEKEIEKEKEKEVETCGVCLETLVIFINNGYYNCKNCRNSFHTACIDEWLSHSVNSSCPICRVIITFIKDDHKLEFFKDNPVL